MTIRARLTIWYALILAVTLLLFGGVLYFEWVVEPHLKSPPKTGPWQDAFEILIEGVIPAFALSLGGGWLLMRRALAPVEKLTRAVESLDERNLKVRLQSSGNGDELDRLTDVFNRMTERIAESFLRVRELTLRASHELKTPLTVLRGALETSLREKGGGAHDAALRDELQEIQRLTELVESLMLVTRAEAGLIEFAREPVCLDELVRDCFHDAEILGQSRGLAVTLASCAPTVIPGDRSRLRQVLLNLVDNAVNYNRPGGSVDIALSREAAHAVVTLSNTGPGIPAEARGRVFDPFYRCDGKRPANADGCGLGLTIARCFVSGHGGTIEIISEPDVQTKVRVLLPT